MRAPRTPRTVLLALAALSVPALLAACADGEGTPQATVTETVMVPGDADPSASPDPEAEGPPGESIGSRAFDAGTVVGVSELEDGETVLELDRWTVVGVDDAELARRGVPVVPHEGDRYTNQNAERTYRVPVASTVRVVFNECVAPTTDGASAGMTSTQTTLQDFLDLPDRAERVVHLAYEDGRLVRLETDPEC